MSYSVFTPYHIILKEKKRKIAALLLIMFTPVVFFNLTGAARATETVTWNTASFSTGVTDNLVLSDAGLQLPLTATTSDDTFEDFYIGNNEPDQFAMTGLLVDGGVEINQGYTYSPFSIPGLLKGWTNNAFIEDGLVYLSISNSSNGGLYVIDTNNTGDPADDELLTRYYSGSVPSTGAGMNWIRHAFKNGNYLYVSNQLAGLTVIDTKGTKSVADDESVATYSTGSSPVSLHGGSYHAFISANILYISSSAGLYVINTQGTPSAADDVLVTRYHSGSSLAITGSVVEADLIGAILYISTDAGLYVINTQGTPSAADDVLVTRYYTGSAIPLLGNRISGSFIDGEILYIATEPGLHAIDTKGTLSAADDELLFIYNRDSEPGILNNRINGVFKEGDYLYISSDSGFYTIDTKGTKTAADDVLSEKFNRGSSPALGQDFVEKASLNGGSFAVLGTYSYLNIVTPGNFQESGIFHGNPRRISEISTTSLKALVNEGVDGEVRLSYRSGGDDAVYSNDFDDGAVSEFLPDPFDWGVDPFETVVESNGVMTLSNTTNSYYSYPWFDTGKPDGYFPAGSLVMAKVRVNSNRERQSGENQDYMISDEYQNFSDGSFINNEWQIFKYIEPEPFSKIGFELLWEEDTWAPEDTFEIDWIKIIPPDSFGEWGEWVECESTEHCVLEDMSGDTWLQYKLELSTTNPNSSPQVTEVVFQGDYAATGTYTSATTDFGEDRRLGVFTPTATLPAGTAISYEYSTDGGHKWRTLVPGEDLDIVASSFMWRAQLATTDTAYSPTLEGASLTHSPYNPSQTSTTLAGQIVRLEKSNPDAVAELKAKYPHFFDGTASDEEINRETLKILAEVLRLMAKLVAQREGEG